MVCGRARIDCSNCGYFFGLQADSWNQDRLARAELGVYLQSLTQELANTTTIRDQQIAWEKKVIKGLMDTLSALEGQDLNGDEQENARDVQ